MFSAFLVPISWFSRSGTFRDQIVFLPGGIVTDFSRTIASHCRFFMKNLVFARPIMSIFKMIFLPREIIKFRIKLIGIFERGFTALQFISGN